MHAIYSISWHLFIEGILKYILKKYNIAQSNSNLVGRSDWDDGRWEWEDTPRRDSHSHTSRHHQPSPSPMLVGASPDVRLVSPWLGGQTPLSAGMFARCELFCVYIK